MPVKSADFHVFAVKFSFAEPKSDDREINHANRHVRHVQTGDAEKHRAEKRRAAPWIHARTQAFIDQVDPLAHVQANECRARR